MGMTNPERIQVLPQYIFRYNDLSQLGLARDFARDKAIYNPGIGNLITTQDQYRIPELAPLIEFVETKGNEILRIQKIPGKFQIVSCWFTRTFPGQHFELHFHPLAMIAGSYYLSEDLTPCVFVGENQWLQHPLSTPVDVMTPVKFDVGDLVFIPASMRHGVPQTGNIREVFSFNAVLTDIGTCNCTNQDFIKFPAIYPEK